MIAIDEFHHVAAADDNRLGEILRKLLAREKAHVMAMTGSYFRGDSVPVLRPRMRRGSSLSPTATMSSLKAMST